MCTSHKLRMVSLWLYYTDHHLRFQYFFIRRLICNPRVKCRVRLFSLVYDFTIFFLQISNNEVVELAFNKKKKHTKKRSSFFIRKFDCERKARPPSLYNNCVVGKKNFYNPFKHCMS